MWGKLAVGFVAAFALATRADAGPALLFDAADGRILYDREEDASSPRPPLCHERLDTLPMDDSAKKAVSIRQTVISLWCAARRGE